MSPSGEATGGEGVAEAAQSTLGAAPSLMGATPAVAGAVTTVTALPRPSAASGDIQPCAHALCPGLCSAMGAASRPIAGRLDPLVGNPWTDWADR